MAYNLKNMHEHIITIHLSCVFILLSVIFKNLNLSFVDAHPTFLIYFFIFSLLFLIEASILHYFRKHSYSNNSQKLFLIDILYIAFPFAIATYALIYYGNQVYYIKALLLIPVIIAGSIKGKKIAYFFAFLCIATLIAYDFFLINTHNIIKIIEADFILICMLLLVGWFSGATYELESEYRNQLAQQANTDNLTQLYNHRYFYENITKLFTHVSKNNPLSLIMMDIDDFKYYNDTNGHLQGDELLKITGKLIRETIPESCFAARYGGEEFVIVLPGYTNIEAANTGERLRKNIENYNFPMEEYQPKGKITISCGISSTPDNANNYKELVEHADQALYKAKSLDKNRVEIYSPIFEELLQTAEEEQKELINSFQTLIKVINAKDRYTYGHSERVMEYSIKLAREIGMQEKDIQLLKYSSFLHDIGKIEIDRELLNKPNQLSENEFKTFKQHSLWGSEIIRAVPQLEETNKVILYHHENYDGSGYPEGLSNNAIPLYSRIIRIADSYDAMTTDRPYRKALSKNAALEEIRQCSGTMFDPELVTLFIKIMSKEESSEL